MAALVIVGQTEITIELSGWNALPSLCRIVHIPLAAIRFVKTEQRPEDESLSRLASVDGPLTRVRTGSVIKEGRRFFLAYRPGDSTVTLELDREHFPRARLRRGRARHRSIVGRANRARAGWRSGSCAWSNESCACLSAVGQSELEPGGRSGRYDTIERRHRHREPAAAKPAHASTG